MDLHWCEDDKQCRCRCSVYRAIVFVEPGLRDHLDDAGARRAEVTIGDLHGSCRAAQVEVDHDPALKLLRCIRVGHNQHLTLGKDAREGENAADALRQPVILPIA